LDKQVQDVVFVVLRQPHIVYVEFLLKPMFSGPK